jgi:hypothetical protein
MTRSDAIVADLRAGTERDVEVARRHGVTPGRVSQIRRAAGLPRRAAGQPAREGSAVYWTDGELAHLVDHADAPVAEVAAALGRSIRAVYEMRHRLAQEGRIPRRRVPLTEAELALLADPGLSHAEVAERTGRSPQVIADARRLRGIRGRQH